MGPVPTAGSIGKVALDPLAGRLSVTAAAGTWTFGFEKNRDLSYVSRRGLRGGAGGFGEEDRACFDGSRAGRMAAALYRPFRASFAHQSSRTPPPTRIASPIKAV